MRPSGFSGDNSRRREELDRSRFYSGSSRNFGGGYYGGGSYTRSGYEAGFGGEDYGGYDYGRYGRGRSASGRYDGDRFYQSQQNGRSQSLEGRDYFDRPYQYRSPSGGYRFESSRSPDRKNFRYSYGDGYGRDRYDQGYGQGRSRYDGFEFEDRYGRSRGRFQDGSYGQQQRPYSSAVSSYQQDKKFPRRGFGVDQYGGGYGRSDRFGQAYGQSYGQYGPRSGRFGYDSERQGYGYDRTSYGRFGGSGQDFDRFERYGRGSDRFSQGSDRFERYGQGYEPFPNRFGQRYSQIDKYGQRDNRSDRFGQGYDRFDQYSQGQARGIQGFERSAYGSDQFGNSSYRTGFDGDRQIDRRYKSDFGRFEPISGRFSGSEKYGRGRFFSAERRYSPSRERVDYRGDRYGQDQSGGRVRFEGEQDDYRRPYPREKFRRASFSETGSRGDFERFDDRRDQFSGRRYDDQFPSRESQYRTESSSNMNRKFEPYGQDRPFPMSYSPGSPRGKFEMQGGSDYQGGALYGTQLRRDRMPPPIPPFSEPRSNYPATKALTWYESSDRFNVNNQNRCRELAVRASYDLMKRRYYENAADPSQNPTWLQRGGFGNSYNQVNVSPEVLRVEFVDFYPEQNAKESRTFDYELVRDQDQPTPVLRRGESFRLTFNFRDREFDPSRDNVYLNFYFGPNPSVPKRTRVVLNVDPSLGKDFERAPYQWDARIQNQEGNKLTVEVFTPSTCPVGMWRCVIETSSRETPSCRLQYRCPEDIYIIFNPFSRSDSVWMENDGQKIEYVMNDSGKVYIGGYRNVRGRPWIYGQFDDCVLPAACLLLEMSGLPHSERGNPVKVARALASMIKSSRPDGRFSSYFDGSSNFGLVEARYEDDFRGGNSPHLWTGSVQIIEEFLRGGATPVKYAQCWVISALMTSLCRALGLPARPVTAFISAMETQDSLTVDRYVDRFGDVLEQGPSQDQPDSVWSFHTWCDVWMNRPDQPQVYSGWQATDPCRSFRDFRDMFSGACGPCPVEALRRGDVGQRDDVDAFYASLNSYVRYFYEDDESGWGYSPFRQFRYPMSRYILTKAVGRYDEDGDNDCDDLTNVYRDNERSDGEKFAIFNACRGFSKDVPPFEYQAVSSNWGPFNPSETDQSNFDVSFELDSPERVSIGEPVTIPVMICNNSPEPRIIQTNICTRSAFYTGVLGPYLKRSSTQLTLQPNQQETITLTLDPWDYTDKLLDMAFIKITVTSFVQETGQSFIDEFDFRFNKPRLNIDFSEVRVGQEGEATFSFTNPLEVPLTDCFLTMEVSGSVRPRTVRIGREVGPRETFTYKQTFVPRFPGEQRMVASFVSRQLQDVVGQRPVVVREP